MARNKGQNRYLIPRVINPPNRRCVTLNIPDDIDHAAVFWGHIELLSTWGAWEYDAAHNGKDVAAVWREVYELARQSWETGECAPNPEDGECFEYPPNQDIFQYAPSNPYTDPNLVPTGYLKPPFHVINSSDVIQLALGLEVGDLYNDLTHFPPGSLPTILPPGGLPRVRVSFNGTSDPAGVTAELHFVKIPAGGRILISIDGQILNPPLIWFDLNRDLLSVPPETTITVTEEVTVHGSGSHFIDITWLPTVNEEAPFLYFGGALRKVVLCGEDIDIPLAEMTIDGCTLRFRPTHNAAWQEFDLSVCARNTAKEVIEGYLHDGTLGGAQPPPNGDTEVGFCKEFQVTLDANGRWLCPIPIKANYTIQISDARGGANDGTIDDWRCPSGTVYFLGECGSGTGGTEPTDPMPALGHMRLIMRYNGSYHDAYNLTHTVSSGLVGSHDLEFQVNDDPLNDNSGQYQFNLQICNYGACVPVFGIEPEFSTSTFADGVFTATAFAPRPDANNAYQVFYDVGDQNNNPCPCRFIEIISLTGYTGPSEEDNFNGGSVYPCEGGNIVNEHGAGVQNWEAFYNGLDPANQCIRQFDVKSVTPFVMKFRVIEC